MISVTTFMCLSSVIIIVNCIYVEPGSLDFSTYLVAPHEVCNDISCITVDKLFFVNDASIRCPVGRLKVAYNDQAGKFRVASAETSKARRSVNTKKLVENCEHLGTTPRYMSPTISSLQKINLKKQQQPHQPHTTTQSTTTTSTIAHSPIDLSSILTDDDSFQTASCSISFDEIDYLNNSFPQNLFDDKGDAIYGTSLVAALLSLIIALVKLNAKSNLAHVQPQISSNNDYSSPKLPAHSTAAQFSNALRSLSVTRSAQGSINHATSIQPVRENGTLASDVVRVNVLPAQASAPVEILPYRASDIPLPFTSSDPVQPNFSYESRMRSAVSQVNEVADYRAAAFCGCKVGMCIKGNCRCHKAKRACGPLCHGGKANLNCMATIDRLNI